MNTQESERSQKTTGGGVSEYLEPPGQELVFNLQEVASVHLALEGLVEDGELDVVLDVLPAGVAVSRRVLWSRPKAAPGLCDTTG